MSQQEVGLGAQVSGATIPKTLNGHGLALNVFWVLIVGIGLAPESVLTVRKAVEQSNRRTLEPDG